MLMMGKSVRQVWVKMKLCLVENAIDTLSLISILISFKNINVIRGIPLDLFCIILIIFANYLKQLSLQAKSCDVFLSWRLSKIIIFGNTLAFGIVLQTDDFSKNLSIQRFQKVLKMLTTLHNILI